MKKIFRKIIFENLLKKYSFGTVKKKIFRKNYLWRPALLPFLLLQRKLYCQIQLRILASTNTNMIAGTNVEELISKSPDSHSLLRLCRLTTSYCCCCTTGSRRKLNLVSQTDWWLKLSKFPYNLHFQLLMVYLYTNSPNKQLYFNILTYFEPQIIPTVHLTFDTINTKSESIGKSVE